VRKRWISYTPNKSLKRYLAIDGGEYVKELRVGTIYVVNAEALLSEGMETKPVDKFSKVGVFRPANYAKERVSELMATAEVKLALKNGERADLILMDGSFSKKLGNANGMESRLDFNVDGIASLSLKDENEMYRSLVVEKQVVISRLLNTYGSKALWISKTSRNMDMFHRGLPDIVVLETFTEEVGYTSPECKGVDVTKLAYHPEVNLQSFVVCRSFIRLKRASKVLKLDVVSKLPIDEAFVRKVIDDLSAVAVKGYPYPLLKVHFDVKIKKGDRERITRMLGLHKPGVDWWPNQFF
jgi:NurA-like 5'-3' nuclease